MLMWGASMARDFAKVFYNSKAWKQCKAGYIKSVYGLCERCLKQGKYVPGWIVHHKVWLTPENINNLNVSLNWDNLEYVCQDCHNNEHHAKYSGVAVGLIFDDDGNLIKDSPH